jgi:hypothetical protein
MCLDLISIYIFVDSFNKYLLSVCHVSVDNPFLLSGKSKGEVNLEQLSNSPF